MVNVFYTFNSDEAWGFKFSNTISFMAFSLYDGDTSVNKDA